MLGICTRSIVVEHVSKDILRVLQALGHLLVVGVQSLTKWHD